MSIKIPDGIHTPKTTFQGSPFFNVIVMYYLSHKYDDVCVILSEPYKTDKKKNIHWLEDDPDHVHDESCVLLPHKISDIPYYQDEVSLRWNEEKKCITVPGSQKKFWETFSKCDSKRFIVFPFGYDCIDSGHAGYCLYDKKEKSLERFESYGVINDDKKCLNPPKLDKEIQRLFKKNLGEDFIKEYYAPSKYSLVNSFQTLQEDEGEKLELSGFCACWCAFWVELRLMNPDIDRKELLRLALKKLLKIKKEKGISLTQFIRNYSGVIVYVSNEIKSLYDQENKK